MANFPTTFAEQPRYIEAQDLHAKYANPFETLKQGGFVVVEGLTRADVPAIAAIAGQAAVREFCPNDLGRRWADEEMTEKQLAKDGGRGVFRLESRETGETAGFGWTGKASEEETELTGAEHTFAIRLNEAFGGRGLAAPFTQAIVFGSMKYFGAKRIGWETWASNHRAVNAYVTAGALLTKAQAVPERPTLDESFPLAEEGKFAGQHVRPDTRLYMKHPKSF